MGRIKGPKPAGASAGQEWPYDFVVRVLQAVRLPLDTEYLRPGLRLAVGVSGGADSVGLLRALAEQRELGLVLHVAHLHHGLRGEEADGDLEFVRALAERLNLPFHETRVETSAAAAADSASGKTAEGIEEAARRLRYGWFRHLMGAGLVDAVATAHTRDDQAETVLAKFLRGAWTEGFSAIHPVVRHPEGLILRPLLGTGRAEVEAYLRAIGQEWREDSSNRHLTYTRNRIRHELLPSLESWNPRLREHLAQMAELAREEEAWWQTEVSRVAPQVLVTGRPVRGGGRAASEDVAIDIGRLGEQPVAVQRRLLRYAAARLGAAPDFPGTESLRELALQGRAGQRCELAQGLRAERTHRELRLSIQPPGTTESPTAAAATFTVPVPGEVDVPAFGVHLEIRTAGQQEGQGAKFATLRPWRPGDRVQLRHSSGPRKVKEVLERMKVTGTERAAWPVLELDGKVVWMQGVAVEQGRGIEIVAQPIEKGGPGTA